MTWSAKPNLPGPVTSDITVTSATFALERLQVVGDAGPGDLRTTQTRFELVWDGTHTPVNSSFPMAPPGLYSRITFDLATVGENTYDIRGEVRVNGTFKPFRVHDDAGVRVSFECEAMLQADGDATVGVRLELDRALGSIDFGLVDEDEDGILELDASDLQISELRDQLAESFTLDQP